MCLSKFEYWRLTSLYVIVISLNIHPQRVTKYLHSSERKLKYFFDIILQTYWYCVVLTRNGKNGKIELMEILWVWFRHWKRVSPNWFWKNSRLLGSNCRRYWLYPANMELWATAGGLIAENVFQIAEGFVNYIKISLQK